MEKMKKSLLVQHIIKPYWKTLAIALFAVVIAGLAELLEPWPIKIVIDYVIGSKHLPSWLANYVFAFFNNDKTGILNFALFVALSVATLGGLMSYVEKSLTIKAGQWIMLDLRQKLYNHLQKLSLSYFDQAKTGDLLSRVTNDIDSVQSFVTSALLGMVINIFMLIGMIGIMSYLNWHFTLIALSITPLLFFQVYRLTRSIKKASREVRKKESDIISLVQEAISSIRIVKAFARENYEVERLRKETEESIRLTLLARSLKARLSPTVDIIIALGTCIVLWYGAGLVLRSNFSAGDLIIFLLYLRMMYKPMRELSKMIDTTSKAQIALERIIEIMKIENQIPENPNAIAVEKVKGEIEFKNIHFSYDQNQLVLKDINFNIKPGQFVAFVGPTGSGKSTIISLIPRFYDPLCGKILIDEKDTKDYTTDSLRNQVSFVLQDPYLFHAPIWQNIAYGKPNATCEDIRRAAKLANATEFIEKMPKGFDTIIGERGVTLSCGQRQRLAIARAIIRDAPILILDEPTSGLDAASEEVVLDALARLMEGRTTIVIAHRLSTIKQADNIFVLNQGEIVESGTHEELLAQNKLYTHLYEIQNQEEEIEKTYKGLYSINKKEEVVHV
ncbi:MAG: ABC transporter ATP-binding protein [Acidobacteria bacterium]|nr:ABC transporter ATP-binding protein [Acidobacteriota bacterium]